MADGGYINEDDSDAIMEIDSPQGGQLKTKNGQKYIINERRDGVPKTYIILGIISILLATTIACLITYLLTKSSEGSCSTNSNGITGNTIAAASVFGLPSQTPTIIDSRSPEEEMVKNRKLLLHEGWNPDIYRITIEPSLKTSTNNGSMSIDLSRDQTTAGLRPIVFDVNNITIDDVRVTDVAKGKSVQIKTQYGDNNETFVIKLMAGVDAGADSLRLRVELNFISQLTDTLQGIYKTSYINIDNGKKEHMISTQFSPVDARRAFPCIDRPDKKANFSLSIVYEKNKFSALSNMPSYKISEHRPGFVVEDFETTPKMSTYLVAFVISNLVKGNESDETATGSNQPKINIWTRSEATDMTEYAHSLTRKVLTYFQSYFNYAFPLPKIDLVSVPDFGFSAMENWGLITFRDSSLLVPKDEERASSAAHTEHVTSIVAHELAHQWFGNLVGIKRWDDLWLKEGFATYMSYLAANHLQPKWNVLESFAIDEFQQSMDKDSDNSSHPISFAVASTNDIRRIFDPISYSKGTILLRMLNSIVGDATFSTGIKELLVSQDYRSIDRDELWERMNANAHSQGTLSKNLNIKDVMNTWVTQPGYPVITVNRKGADLTISQQRYMLPAKDSTDNSMWYIPITFETDDVKKGDDIPTHWLTPEDKDITIPNVFSSANNSHNVVYVNLNRNGYYRVNYDYPSWAALAGNFKDLPKVTRAQLLDDALHLAQAEYLGYDIPLTFLLGMINSHDDDLLWKSAQHGLQYLINMLQREPAYESFRAMMRFIVRPAFDTYGLAEPSTESHLELAHRARVVRMACRFNYDRCTMAAQQKYREWMGNPAENMIKPNLKETIYCTTLSEGSFQEWYFAYKQYKRTASASEKEQILSALGCTTKPWLLSKYLNMTIDENSGIRKQDGALAFSAVAKNAIGYEIAFDFLSTNIKEISEYFGDGFSTVSKMIDSITTYMNKDYHMEQLDRFALRARKLGLRSVETAIESAMVKVNNNILWRKRSYYNLKTFLESLIEEMHINIY